ncbi:MULTISPECIES: sensor histidine kinase [Pseudomonas aeruginosa group]|uniref:sensor histidine kinase n=1 Tax=Pseudomonas aeruginosa group TaxID=136841 RepID=UPI0021F8AF35|nr:sensor histidine kinase [Pseudomonas aeruginosa]UYT18439.1 ATP-binding protein [Pseudomonas aeruginosa]
MEIRKKIGDHPFTVEARVAIQLGRESISSSLVAISELVKNAYDADAEIVEISFEGLGTKAPKLTITDDGDGMDKNLLLTKWMRIGTTHKSESGLSNKKRVYTGAKGLGRLGIDRLCNHLKLYTKTESCESVYEVDINWNKYNQVKSAELDSIRHDVFEIDGRTMPSISFPVNDKGKGSKYVLTELKDSWTEEFLEELRKELSLLVSPFSKNLDFKVKFNTNGSFPKLDGFVSSEHFLEAAEWRLESSISASNEVLFSIYDGNGKLSEPSTPVSWESWMPGGEKVPRCGPLSFTLYFMRNIASREINTDKFKPKDIRGFLKSNQGVRIYRDHFRVKPYGDPSGEGDWLGLAMRRVINPESITMDNWRIGYNQVVGAVFIGRNQNPNLVDQTNREGLTETPAYFELRKFALKCVELFEKHIQTKAREEKEKRPPVVGLSEHVDKSFNTYKDVIEAIKKVKSESNQIQVKQQLEEIEATLSEESERTARVKEKVDQLEAEKDTLANLASLGILSVSFGHETLAAISNAITNGSLLRTRVNDGFFMLPIDVVEFANKRFDQIEKSLNYIKIFGNFSLGNVRRDKRARRTFNLATVASNVISSFEDVLANRKTTAELVLSNPLPPLIRAFEIDWESIFANLITNSCWALQDTPAGERKIRITVAVDDGDCVVFFEDSGCGIEAGVESHIFKATFSTKRNQKGDTIGTGMGLSIVKTFVEEHSGGTIELANKGALGGARFLIKVPLAKSGAQE